MRSVTTGQDTFHTIERNLIADGDCSGFALPGDRPHYLRDLQLKTKHIKITCKFDIPAKQVIGEVELTLTPIKKGVNRIELDSEDTQIRATTVNGAESRYEHIAGLLTIILDEPLTSTDDIVVKINYVSTPRRGIYFTGPDDDYPDKPYQIWTQGQDTDNHYWFPCVDEPRGRITSEVICDVPDNWVVISNGQLRDTTSMGDGYKRFHWVQDKPHAVYLITLVAGELERVVLDDSEPVVDFYCAKDRVEDAKRSFKNTVAMLKLFSEVTGVPYPWAKYTQVAVQDFIFGGMENTSATTQTDQTLHDAKAHKDFSSDYLVAHEAAHQWFGDLITCREWPHGWLNEGFATFLEALWQEHHRGRDEYYQDILTMVSDHMAEEYRRPIVERTYRQPTDIFDRHLYEKGALVLHMLREELTEEQFSIAIKHYVKTNINRNVITPDLQKAIEEATGRNMDWFFDQWVYSPGHPEFNVSYAWDGEMKVATVSVEQTQKRIFRCSTEIAFYNGDSVCLKKININAKQHTFAFTLDQQPEGVQFDPNYKVLKTLKFSRKPDMLIHQLQNATTVVGRIEAARELGKMPSVAVAEALGKTMNGKGFWGVRAAAAGALGKLRSPQALKLLTDSIEHEHFKVRRAIATALGNFKNDKKVYEPLLSMLKSEDSYYVSGAAAASMGSVNDPDFQKALKEALGRDAHIEAIRAGALNGLGKLRTKEALDTILEWTRRGYPQRARMAAAGALGEFYGEHKDTAVETLIELLYDDWFQVKLLAIASLRKLEATKAIPKLQEMLARELDDRVIRNARVAIKDIQSKKSDKKRIEELNNKLEEFGKENNSLKERLAKVEEKLKGTGS